MHFIEVSVSQSYKIPRAELFQLTQNLENRLLWDPLLQKIQFLGEIKKVAIDAVVYTESKKGGAMTTLYINVVEPCLIEVVMIGKSKLFSSFKGKWIYEVVSPQQTLLTIQYTYKLRFPYLLIGRFINVKITGENKNRLESLNKYIAVYDKTTS
jgi:predicted transglutaminase-like protease